MPTAVFGERERLMRQREFPLSVNEELFLHLDAEDEPQTMHLEARFDSDLNPSKIRTAATLATRAHPMTRAQLARRRILTLPPQWTLSGEQSQVPVEVQRADSEPGMQQVRSDFYSRGFDLRTAPLLRILVVHRPGGDSLLLSMHHAVADGVGLARYLDSLLNAYAEQRDTPPPDIDPIDVRYLTKTFGDRFPPPSASAKPAAKKSGKRAFLAPSQPSSARGYGFVCLLLPRDWKHPERKHRDLRGSRGEYCMQAALHRAIEGWNHLHFRDVDTIATLMPMNIRDAQWKRDIVANIVLSGELTSTSEERKSNAELLRTISSQIRSGKAGETFGATLHPPTVVRTLLVPLLFTLPKRPSRRLARDAAVMTCAGPGDSAPPDEAAVGKVVEVWGSPPTAMPMGVAMCAMSLGSEVFITLRFHRTLFDDAAAGQFSSLYLDALETFSLEGPAESAPGISKSAYVDIAGRGGS
jgi:hypothetical protein